MRTAQDEGGSKLEALDKQVEHVLAEARMLLPGIQALFGFQLVAIFNRGFDEKLGHAQKCMHLAALGLVALSTALVMTPAAYHRLVEPTAVSPTLVRVGTRCLNFAMCTLLVAIAIDFHIIAHTIVADARLCAALTALLVASFVGLWYVLPLASRARGR